MAATHEAHPQSTRFYWIVAIVLAVVTVAEVGVTFMGLEKVIEVLILLVLSAIKGSAVVMFFMHLRGDARVFKFLFLVPLSIAVSMVLVFMALFSGHVGIAG